MEKRDNSKRKLSNLEIFQKIVIGCVFTLITVVVVHVMLNVYKPEQNSVQALSSVCMDIISMIFLLILLGDFEFEKREMGRRTRMFRMLLLSTSWAIFLDFLNWAYDGSLSFDNITGWFTVGSLCMGAILAGIFNVYLSLYMEEKHGLSQMRKSARVCAILNLISFVITLTLALTRTAFEFVDGHYQIGGLYDIVTAIPILTLLYMTAYSIRYVKVIGLHDIIAVTGYILFMILGILIESQYTIGTTYVSVAIADVFIFVMLQNEIIELETKNAQKWRQRSNTDELTGLLNRYAFETEIEKLEADGADVDFVYVSADVNGLKTVNDSLGHSAGDELLIGVTECFSKCFGEYGKLYRIGGDEFAAFLNVTDSQLEELKANLDIIVKNWHGEQVESLTVSCGYVTKKEEEDMSVRQMVVLADKRMYEEKANYYKTTGIERRG